MRTLKVYLDRDFAGHLIQDKDGQMVFNYEESYIGKANAIPLSYSLPLKKGRFKRNECRGYFGGILPEEDKRESIAKSLGISNKNDFAMLEQIGGECAGAVTFLKANEELPEQNYGYKELSERELAKVLSELPERPLMVGEDGIRFSLAGAQDKIVVCIDNGKIAIPLGGAPSTHILKPATKRFADTVYNEAFCLRLAGMIGLPAAKVEIRSGEIDYLLVERYDRKHYGSSIKRLHQEDFCQALGIPSELKYQSEGGPNIKTCFDLLRKISSAPVVDLQHLLNAIIFNFLVGNNDAHGKNFSILYQEGTLLTGNMANLTPLYDILCTAYYEGISKRMAMKIGGESEFEKVYPRHFDKLADDAGLTKPMVRDRVVEIAKKILSVIGEVGINNKMGHELTDLIRKRCEIVLGRFDE